MSSKGGKLAVNAGNACKATGLSNVVARKDFCNSLVFLL